MKNCRIYFKKYRNSYFNECVRVSEISRIKFSGNYLFLLFYGCEWFYRVEIFIICKFWLNEVVNVYWSY